MMAGKLPASRTPEIVEMAPRNMAVVRTVGEPSEVLPKVMPALYGAVYTLKFDLKKKGIAYKVGALCGRWPNVDATDRARWIAYWGIALPDDVTQVVQKVPDIEVKVERWEYGTVAQVLHLGPYSEEGPTIEGLLRFIAESGYEIAGPHEEEYFSSPQAKVPKTVIRYQVRRK